MTSDRISYKPFLKWAGGKNWLASSLPSLLNGLSFNTYHEPFLGGGSVFFALLPKKAILSDLNKELIETYIGLRDEPDKIIKQLKRWPVSKDDYYRIRDHYSPRTQHTQAARFIYLNRTSFNGLYRVNRNGEYNVPYGHRDGYSFDYQRLKDASIALSGTKIVCQGFEQSLNAIRKNDLVFLDPPYTVSHNKNGFIEYNKTLFSIEDQYKLKDYIDLINERGAFYILTNAAHEEIFKIFNDKSCICLVAKRNSLLGGKKAKRGIVEEYVFTNIKGAVFGEHHE